MIFILSLIIIEFLLSIRGQDFCDSYVANNKSMIFSADNINLFVFIGNSYWILSENDKQLVFKSDTKQAFGNTGDINITDRMSTVFLQQAARFSSSQPENYFVFYDVRQFLG